VEAGPYANTLEGLKTCFADPAISERFRKERCCIEAEKLDGNSATAAAECQITEEGTQMRDGWCKDAVNMDDRSRCDRMFGVCNWYDDHVSGAGICT
jgi:hypothetical protein